MPGIVGKVFTAVGNVFGYGTEHEKNKNIRYYHKQIKRLRKAKGYAQDFIEVDERLETETDIDLSKALEKQKAYFKKKFRDID